MTKRDQKIQIPVFYQVRWEEWQGTEYDDQRPCHGKSKMFYASEREDKRPAGQKEMDVIVAKRLCGGCKFQKQCLKWALDYPHMTGILGGLTFSERQCVLGKCKHQAKYHTEAVSS
jgi:hypothetical protein